MKKYVYRFNEGNKDMRDLLGGKGANLAEMTRLGLPVPKGFTITTECSNSYYHDGEELNIEIRRQIEDAINDLERETGKKFGDLDNPLLVSVRSGARVSMPGMMDTILNLGLNDKTVEAFAKKTNNPRFAYDSYRRFIMMYSDVVMNIPKKIFEDKIDELKNQKGVRYDIELDENDFKNLIVSFKKIYHENINKDFPQDIKECLFNCVKAVFRSWNNERAIYYRKINNFPDEWGTAVNIQEMVFGNLNENSGTGVAFTRNPSTGEKGMFGEYLINAQGEDVVAGIRTPKNIASLKEDMPDVYDEFVRYATKLENYYKDMQDMEFTIEDKKLYMLQTRNGKRTAAAAVKIACDLMDEGIINEEDALMRIESNSLDQLLHKVFVKNELEKSEVIGKGLAASPGAASGMVVFTSKDAIRLGKKGENKRVILVRLETTPEDILGMHSAEGVLTIRGGMTSHAAVVARGMGICCVSGCEDIKLNADEKMFSLNGHTFKEGDFISIDGSTGNIYKGDIKTEDAKIEGNFKRILDIAKKYKRLGVMANADTKEDALNAVSLGAEGIGLCRTEHMFFKEERINVMREMILSSDKEEREKYLLKLEKFQQQDFEDILRVLEGRPITVRYLDPPLHEFLPKKDEEVSKVASEMNLNKDDIIKRINDLHEVNPMMGHRGCRLALTYPEIAIMQTKALINAGINVEKETGIKINIEIMIPLVSIYNEFIYVKDLVKTTADKLIKENNSNLTYEIGTMIEDPRAVVISSKLAKEAEFFSYGTNDLTQLTFGFSRDDAEKFIQTYLDKGILKNDPFKVVDEEGVGYFVNKSLIDARNENPNIKLGVCGEHGGEESSINFFNKIGLDYVSCSPYRVPIAILSAAKAAIKAGSNK